MTITEERKLIEDTPLSGQDMASILKLLGLQKMAVTPDVFMLVKAVRYYKTINEGVGQVLNRHLNLGGVILTDEPTSELPFNSENGKV